MSGNKYAAVSGLVSRMRMMEAISEQLSSVSVRSYKKGTPSFQAELAEARSGMATKGINFVRVSGETIDFTPAQLEFTGDPLHLALNGDGFFQLQREDGSLGYTRKGLFKINAEGILSDANDQPVMAAGGGPITLPSPEVEIAPDGNVWFEGQQIARIGVFQFADNSVLKRAQGSMFLPDDGSQPELHPDPQLAQKNLEGSNVNLMKTMAQMTGNLRAFEATQKALKIYSDMDSKAAEIGSIQ